MNKLKRFLTLLLLSLQTIMTSSTYNTCKDILLSQVRLIRVNFPSLTSFVMNLLNTSLIRQNKIDDLFTFPVNQIQLRTPNSTFQNKFRLLY